MPLRFSFLRFGRRSRVNPAPAVQNPDHVHFQLPPRRDVPLDPLDPQAVPPQWHRLKSLDPDSHDYNELLEKLVGVEGNRKVAMKFTGEDAEVVINIVGEALKTARLQKKLAHRGFVLLRKLAAHTGRLPDSYLVKKDADFRVEKTILAAGGFADVRRGTLAETKVAVKTIRVAETSDFPNVQKDFCKESVLWMHTSHPNVLELLAVDINPETGALSMISELMENGNIVHYIRTNEANRIRLLGDVTRGLSYLHKCGIVHGDLKGSNVLIKNGPNPQACLADFGFSAITSTASFAVSMTGDECKGTWSHMAPELLHPSKFDLSSCRVSKQADIYAFGIVVYEVLTGRHPFGMRRHQEVISLVLEGKRPGKPENAGDIGFGEGTWELAQQCWDQERGERPTVEQVSEHFERVAENSSIVPPGPTISAYSEAEAPTASVSVGASGNFTRLFTSQKSTSQRGASQRGTSQRGASILQKTKMTMDLMNSGGAPPPLPAPRAQLTPAKASLFKRFGAHIIHRKPAPRIDAAESPSART